MVKKLFFANYLLRLSREEGEKGEKEEEAEDLAFLDQVRRTW
jgi:hypothetical protein